LANDEDFENLLRLRQAQPEIRRHQVRQSPGLMDIGRDGEDLGRQILQRQQLLHAIADRAHQRFGLDTPFGLVIRREGAHRGPGRRLVLHERLNAGLAESLDEGLHTTVGQAQDAHHHGDGAHAVEIVGLRILDGGVPLRGQQHQPFAGQRVLDGGDRALPRHEEREHHVGEDDQLPQRENRQLFRDLELHAIRSHPPVFRRGRGTT
jgi:hypothetical protein